MANATPGGIGRKLRGVLLSTLVDVAGEVSVGRDMSILSGNIHIGDRVSVNTNVTIGASEKGVIEIGDDAVIAQNVVIRESDHEFMDSKVPINQQGHAPGKIIIGDDFWIGANSVIRRNARIGQHTFVAVGAVVTKDVPEWAIVGAYQPR